jgi:sensor histidine kinase regulating citrate/malate metabolism
MAFSAYFMIFRFFVQTQEQLNLQNEQNLLKKQVTASQVHLETLQESQEKTIMYRHDMRHHLNLIDTFLEDDNKTAARKYIAEVEKTIQGAVVEKYCSNYTVNLLLSFYLAKAKNDQIKVQTQIVLPEETTVSDMDLCVIFSNAIENALNACLQIPDISDRAIQIVCYVKNNKLFIQITNSCQGAVLFDNGLPLSTEENHGLGTKSIAAVAQKYGGVYSFQAEDGFFKSSVIL